MATMTSSTFTRPGIKHAGAKPGTWLLNKLFLALRFVMPYALSLAGLTSFVYAGFLYSKVAGFIVLGICLVVADRYIDENLAQERGD